MKKENNSNEKTSKFNEPQALYQHYERNHEKELKIMDKQLTNAYKVIFVEKPTKFNLDTAENFWITKLKSKINIMRTFLPTFK